MKSVITALEPVASGITFSASAVETPYTLEIKGQPEPMVKVTRLVNPENGSKMVRIVAMASAGQPILSLSTMDAIARRILPNARVTTANKGSAAFFRLYSA
jgi:hypothetical protein